MRAEDDVATKALRPALAATTGGPGDRLCKETRRQPGYDLAPRLRTPNVPTLLIHVAPRSRFVVLDDCGRSSDFERTVETPDAIAGFLGRH